MRHKTFISILLLLIALPCQAYPPSLEGGLALLRNGQFDQATLQFSAIDRADPSGPEGPLFEGFTLWWRLLDRPDDQEALHLRMEERFDEAAIRGARLGELDDPDERHRGLTFSGVALLLQAQSRASRGAHRAAADAARRGHAALSAVTTARPGSLDPLFALGAYNYFADNLPLIVKGLRFFLNIPGGDEKLGLSQLEEAGRNSEIFGTEALMLLAHIHSRTDRGDARLALGFLRKAADRHPGSPLIKTALSDLLFRTGRIRESQSLAEQALALLASQPGFSSAIEPLARYRSAACSLRLGDPAAVLAMGRAVLPGSTSMRHGEARRWAHLLIEAAIDSGVPQEAATWVNQLPLPPESRQEYLRWIGEAVQDPGRFARGPIISLPQVEMEVHALRDLVAAHPGNGWLHHRLGSALGIQGKYGEARIHLNKALAIGPAEAQGLALMRLGWIAEQRGERRTAISYYRRCASFKKFEFALAASERILYPATGRPEL